jgi:NTP pyrophosphatase (non-canonical NTP hydrolase)
MKEELISRVNKEEEIAKKKWGSTDRSPQILLNAATEELGEVAHAINHLEGKEAIKQEIVETIGILSRIYEMVDVGVEYLGG